MARQDGKARQQEDNGMARQWQVKTKQNDNKSTARQGLVNVSYLMYCNTELAPRTKMKGLKRSSKGL